MPAVDITETEKGYKVVAELPGMDEKNIEVKIANGMLTIKGEKQEDKEEEKQRGREAGGQGGREAGLLRSRAQFWFIRAHVAGARRR